MLRLIAYDIASPKRLKKVASICQDYGLRVEFSLFECELSEMMFQHFWSRLQQAINPQEDKVIAYPICRNCLEKISVLGLNPRPQNPQLFIF